MYIVQLIEKRAKIHAQTNEGHLIFCLWKQEHVTYPQPPPVLLRVLFIWSSWGLWYWLLLLSLMHGTHIVNMSANQQLWKASKRGDIAVVRQAVSDGADIWLTEKWRLCTHVPIPSGIMGLHTKLRTTTASCWCPEQCRSLERLFVETKACHLQSLLRHYVAFQNVYMYTTSLLGLPLFCLALHMYMITQALKRSSTKACFALYMV